MRVDRYELLGRLGAGGAGQVFRARDTHTGREFALKVLHPRPDSEGANLKRFQREVEALANLNHPGLVKVYDCGTHKATRYLVMDLIDGESVEDRVQRSGPLKPAEAAEVTRAVAEALQHVHDAGLIHRDLKPANVMLARDGAVYLSDFGLVKDLDPEISRLTLSGALVGTPGYWAPELASGHPEQATSLSDVYGLGGLLYGALTGAPPLDGTSLLEILGATHTREVEPPSQHNPRVDRVLDAICLRCLRKEPEQRYRSARAVAADLSAYLRGELRDPHTVGGVRGSRNQRLPFGAWAFIGASVAAVVMVSAALLAPHGQSSAPSPEPPAPEPAALRDPPLPAPGPHPGERPEPKPNERPGPRPSEPPRPAKPEVRALLDAAARALAEGRRVEAIDLARQGVGLDPQSPWLQFALGDALLATGDLWGARRAFSKAVELAPTWAAAYYNRSLCLSREKLFAEALSDLDEALRLDPGSANLLQQRGLTYMELGEPTRALGDITAALRLTPSDARAHHNLGVILVRLDRKREALDAFNTSLELDPRLAKSYLRRGALRVELGLGDPLSDLNRAIELEPEFAAARYVRGMQLAGLGRLPEAETDLSVAAVELSSQAELHFQLGSIRRRLKRYKDAERAFDHAAAASPTPRVDIHRARGLTRKARKNYRGALEDFEKALSLEPNHGELNYQRALTYLKLKNWPEALAAFTRTLALGHQTQWAYNGRGYVFLELENLAAALPDFERAWELDPTQPRIIYNLGLTKARLGRHAEAIADYDRASALDPEYVRPYQRRAESKLALGDEQGALKELDTALDLDPKHLRARRQRGLLRAELGDAKGAREDFLHYLQQDPTASGAKEVREALIGLAKQPRE